MKIKLELYGASREFSEKDYLKFNLKEKSSINDLRNEILSFIDKNFKGNSNFKKLVKSSKFCSEENNIVGDRNYYVVNGYASCVAPSSTGMPEGPQ